MNREEIKEELNKVYEGESWDYLTNYILCLQHQVEEKDKVIKEKNKCLLEIAKETIEMVNWLKSKGMNFDNESWVNELEEILESGKNGK